MSGKLDQSLDEIMKDRPAEGAGVRRRGGRLPNRKAATKSKVATTAVIVPTGGVQKKTKGAKPVKAALVPATTGDSKISVSNLPHDVTEVLIKDYFSSTVAPVKRVILNYGPDGKSRGSCTVTFGKPTAAAEAVRLDGTKVDGRQMRIEVVMGAKSVPPPQPPKPLSQRVAQPKNAAKEKAKKGAANTKPAANGVEKKGENKKKGKSGRAGRPKAKTAAELDAEMQDYFGAEPNGAAPNGAAPPASANGGDSGMEEIS